MSGTPWRIEPMGEDHLDAVVAIEQGAFPNPWPRKAFLSHGSAGHARSWVLVDPAGTPGTVEGYICFWVLEGEMEIHDIAVRGESRRRGAATRLLEAAFEEARRCGCHRAWLEVRPSNRAALELYARWSFREMARRRGYYENGEDALILAADLPPAGG